MLYLSRIIYYHNIMLAQYLKLIKIKGNIVSSPAYGWDKGDTILILFLYLCFRLPKFPSVPARTRRKGGWRASARGSGAASMVRSGISDKMSSSHVVKTHQNLTFGKLTDSFVGGTKCRFPKVRLLCPW